MVHAFETNFQSSHDKSGLSFKGTKSSILKEEFSNLNIHDHSFNVDYIGIYFCPSSPSSFDFYILFDLFDDPLSLNFIIFVNILFIYELDYFYHPLDGDSLIVVSPKSIDFSLPP